jgi:1-acyl-sn-glycerol-3-phosphate acyltransferase
LRLEIIGTENLKEIKGPIIIAPNHTSELDPTVIPLIFPFLSLKLPIYSVIYPIEKYKTKDWKWKRFIYGKLFFNLLGGYSTY